MQIKTLDKTWIENPIVDLVISGQKCSIYTDFICKELIRERSSGEQFALWEGIMKSNHKDWKVTIN